MRVLLLDTFTNVMVDTLAIILNQRGHEARGVYSSAVALGLVDEFKPDWVFAILNNIIDAKPEEVVLEMLRKSPSCKFFITASRPMPEFEDRLWENGYALQNLVPWPIHPQDFLAFFSKEQDSMIVRAAEGQTPKFIMYREVTR